MFGKTFPPARPGMALSARAVNRLGQGYERFSRLSAAAPLSAASSFGILSIRNRAPDRVKARLIASGGGGKYSWQGIYDTAGGGYADLPGNIAGTTTVDPTYEDNGNATLTAGMRVDLERGAATGEWRFQFDHC